jgi:hypothetical protein
MTGRYRHVWVVVGAVTDNGEFHFQPDDELLMSTFGGKTYDTVEKRWVESSEMDEEVAEYDWDMHCALGDRLHAGQSHHDEEERCAVFIGSDG